MSLEVKCSSCRSSFKVDERYAGKRGQCPKCGTTLVIPSERVPSVSERPSTTPPPPPRLPEVQISGAPPSAPTGSAPNRTSFLRRLRATAERFHWSVTAASVLIALVVGYFLGREHIKHELRSAFSAASKAFSEGLQESFSGGTDQGKVETPSRAALTPSTETRSNATDAAVSKASLPKVVEFGQPFAAPGFELALIEARVDRPEVKDLFGQTGLAETPNLLLRFKVKNTDDRKMLRYDEGNMFLGGHFHLCDDVENKIRGVGFGAGSKPRGALDESEDILPGQEVTHLEVFSVPPPKTKYLIVTVDLAAFGGDGKARFKLSSERIENFQP